MHIADSACPCCSCSQAAPAHFSNTEQFSGKMDSVNLSGFIIKMLETLADFSQLCTSTAISIMTGKLSGMERRLQPKVITTIMETNKVTKQITVFMSVGKKFFDIFLGIRQNYGLDCIIFS